MPEDPLYLGSPGVEVLTDDDKIGKIRYHFECIMKTLGLDLAEEGLKETPGRVARMYVKEIFSGLNPKNYPVINVFENSYEYGEMLIERTLLFTLIASIILCRSSAKRMWHTFLVKR